MRYRLTISPRAPRRGAGLLIGLVLSLVPGLLGLGYASGAVAHAAAAVVVSL